MNRHEWREKASKILRNKRGRKQIASKIDALIHLAKELEDSTLNNVTFGDLMETWVLLRESYKDSGNIEEADKMMAKILDAQQAIMRSGARGITMSCSVMAEELLKRGNKSEAEKYLRHALDAAALVEELNPLLIGACISYSKANASRSTRNAEKHG